MFCTTMITLHLTAQVDCKQVRNTITSSIKAVHTSIELMEHGHEPVSATEQEKHRVSHRTWLLNQCH